MKNLIMAFASIAFVSKAYGQKFTKFQKRDSVREVSAILELDKLRPSYKSALMGVDIHPKFDCERDERNCSISVSKFTQSLLPYFLLKEKKDDAAAQSGVFLKLLKVSESIEKYVQLSSAEKSIYSFIKERFQSEQNLFKCSSMKSQYEGQRLVMDTQVKRVSFSNEEDLSKQLSDSAKRLKFINIEFSR